MRLGAWAFGWFSAASQLLKNNGQGPGDLFLIFWLGAWTVGGILVFFTLFRILRPTVPETLLLSQPSITYDSGVAPFQFSFSFRSQMDMWKKLFQKRLRTEFDPIQIQTLKLREFDTGNRLTVDQGNKRIEIAADASELEREWLYELLKNEFKLWSVDFPDWMIERLDKEGRRLGVTRRSIIKVWIADRLQRDATRA
jgi:hypothetical protein